LKDYAPCFKGKVLRVEAGGYINVRGVIF